MSLHRLTGWNIFFSASWYERSEAFTWAALSDLVCLIDLITLHDSLHVLGDASLPPFITHHTPFFEAIKASRLVQVDQPLGDQEARIRSVATRRLELYLGPVGGLDAARLLEAARDTLRVPAQLSIGEMNTDVRHELTDPKIGSSPARLRRLLSSDAAPAGLPAFLARTFYYAAYSDVENIPWVPDHVRVPLARDLMKVERGLAEDLRKRLQKHWEDTPISGRLEILQRTSPFAAVVFMRCKGDRTAIPDEMLGLRNEFSQTRMNLLELESELHSSRDRAVEIKRKWLKVLGEVDKRYGPSPARVTLESGISLAEDAAEVVPRPEDVGAWLKALGGLPMEFLKGLLRRRPIAQIHRIRRELPAAATLKKVINVLFPNATDYLP